MKAEEFNERFKAAKSAKIQVYPCHNLRASNLGHPCERYLYLLITQWEDQKPYDVGLQCIFDLGNTMEKHTIENIKEAGFEVLTPTSRSWKIDKPLITGREDILLKDENHRLIPVEIKGLSPFEYDALNTVDDFFNSKRHYVRAYPAQLLIYMYQYATDYGFFALTNKVTGETKFIRVDFNFEYADALIKKAERIYKAIEAKILPEPIEDASVCERCPLQHVCGKVTRIPTDVELDDELETMIDQKEALRESKKSFEDLDEQIKAKIGEREKVLAGKYLIVRSKIVVKGSTVVRPESVQYRVKITTVGE